MKQGNVCSVECFVRVRPLAEGSVGPPTIVVEPSSNTVTLSAPGLRPSLTTHSSSTSSSSFEWTFDRAFGPEATQSVVFSHVAHLVRRAVEGYNATLFAYGQTASGKTHTMLGPGGTLSLHPAMMGVIPRSARLLFSLIHESTLAQSSSHVPETGTGSKSASAAANVNVQFQVRASFVEIYNGQVFDLLSRKESRSKLKICADHESGASATSGNAVKIVGATEIVVETSEQVLDAISKGVKQRATASTDLNEYSSRSHAIFTLHVEKRVPIPVAATDGSNDPRRVKGRVKCFISKINLVDLAGSEDVNRSHATGVTFTQAVQINSDLLVLHRVIDSIVKGESFIPYRDSVLTRLLQDSLGGSSHTIFFAHVSPAIENTAETYSTLLRASAAKAIKNVTSLTSIERVEELDVGQVSGDYPDPEVAWRRRTCWISTSSYGKVFARVAGDLANPIDCPGYGRSPGNRQTIRSYPGLFLTECLAATGHKKAHLLMGSSQGTASSFNAVVEFPAITKYLAGMDPVTHDPKRFSVIQQPTLLVYDTDDLGHPVSVGRVVKRILPCCHYYEYTRSREPYWNGQNLWKILLQMFQEHDSCSFSEQATLPATVQDCGGILAWMTPFDREWPYNDQWAPIQEGKSGLNAPDCSAFQFQVECERAAAEELRKCREVDLFAEEETKEDVESEEVRENRLVAEAAETHCHACGKEIAARLPGYISQTTNTESSRNPIPTYKPTAPPLKSGTTTTSTSKPVTNPPKRTGIPTEQRIPPKKNTQSPTTTAISPVEFSPWLRLSPCRHLLCAKCGLWSLGINPKDCPVALCPQPHIQSLEAPSPSTSNNPTTTTSSSTTNSTPSTSTTTITKVPLPRPLLPGEFHLILEFGNTAKRADDVGRYAITAFLSVVGRGPYSGQIVSSVSFNINPDFPKSAIRVTEPPFQLERTMASLFPCDMLVQWRPDLSLPKLNIAYQVQQEQPVLRRRLLVRVVAKDPKTAQKPRSHREPIYQYQWYGRDLDKPTVSWIMLQTL
ncbi:Kinesin motor domain [Pelomyxa schiedti]|nr:Kinesin motor domain [Pelomyxa schiedti]